MSSPQLTTFNQLVEDRPAALNYYYCPPTRRLGFTVSSAIKTTVKRLGLSNHREAKLLLLLPYTLLPHQKVKMGTTIRKRIEITGGKSVVVVVAVGKEDW